ncbi:MAG TPA: hypothetical protein VNH83_25290, partial [Bryobacteraceae bacterium]|nr:hypothetical protein [Bryobacteraceae bacterium]
SQWRSRISELAAMIRPGPDGAGSLADINLSNCPAKFKDLIARFFNDVGFSGSVQFALEAEPHHNQRLGFRLGRGLNQRVLHFQVCVL